MNYLPSDFDNKQEYAFEWLQNENNNIILTTNRTGDGVVYVYQDGKKVGTYLARNSSDPLPLYETAVDFWGNDYKIEIGEVYNDNFAGIVQSNGLNIIYSSHAKDVDDSYYSTVSFFVPHKITQTVTYKNSKGKVIDRLTHTQDGLTGQSYTTGLPSGSDYVQPGEYLVNTTHNGNGLISEFHDGYTCTKNYHDGVSVKFTENDSEKTGTGTMDYVIYDGDEAVQQGSLAYGQSTDYANDSGEYTIVNPYVPQTTNIVYQYKKLGNVVNIDPEGKTTKTLYTNDPNDPTKVESINVPSIPGYTTMVNGKTVSDKTIMPADPGQDTYITYSANDGTQTIIYKDKDKDGSEVGQQVINGKTDETVKVTPDVPDGYVVKGEIPTEVTIQPDDTPITVTVEHGKSHIDPEHPVNSGDHIPGTKDKTYPTGLTHNDLNKTVTREVTITDPKGKKSTTTQTVTFTRGATVDEVTNKVTYDDWSENGKHTFDKVDVPTVPGYTASGEVPKVEVTPDTQSSTVNITYSANAQKAKITYIDDTTKTNLDSKDANGKFGQAITFETAPTNEIANYEKQGYVLVSNSFNNQMYDANDSNNVFYVHLKHDIVPVTPDNPGHPDAPINPNDPDGPKWPAGTDKDSLTKTGTQTIHYVGAGDKTPADNTQTYTFIKSMVIDKVTGKVLDPGSWNIDSYTFGTVKTPVIPGYHADKAVAGGETVTPDDLNKVITVTYAPDGNPGNPSDHGDTPSPEPTPEPEPTPNPTPDDQPDSEISSDEYFENVKPEDKLDKTNPKKVDAYKKQRKIIKTKIAKQGHTEIAEPIEDKVTRENNVKVVSDPVENTAAEPTLPQTGEADNSIIGLLGMLLASFAAMFGFDSLHSHDKKHKN
ncbi:mucin-binding protein [Lactobacillus crispatus]|uniref:mucin-binding protein n=1 Tax=Lactobacillus crispatus TaxID=47770 RepID=UPI00374FB593